MWHESWVWGRKHSRCLPALHCAAMSRSLPLSLRTGLASRAGQASCQQDSPRAAADPCNLLCCAALPQTTPWALTDAFVSYFLEQKANLQVHTLLTAQRSALVCV